MITANKIQNTDLTLTECKELYWDDTALAVRPVQLHRLDSRGMRKYFTTTDENKVDKMYTSVTSFSTAVMPKGEGLLNWFKTKTPEQIEDILNQSSHYGTCYDILCNKLLAEKLIQDVPAEIRSYLMQNQLYHVNAEKWTYLMKRDLLAFVEFMLDYDVKPLATSVALTLPKHRLAGTIDLLCEMNDRILTKTEQKKGESPKRIKAVVDYKCKIGDFSGNSERASFYDSECLQLYIYAQMVSENLGIPVEAVFNFSPKNWRKVPDYNLRHWNTSVVWERITKKFPAYCDIFNVDYPDEELEIQVINDAISIYQEENMRIGNRIDLLNEQLERQRLEIHEIIPTDID